MKRITALLLTMAMALSLAACGNDGDTGGSSSQTPESTAEKESKSSQEEAPDAELVTLKILHGNDWTDDAKPSEWESFDIGKPLADKLAELGIKLELESVPSANLAEVVNTRMAAGVDLPDIISLSFVGGVDVVKFGKNGLIYPASKLMEEYDEDGSIAAFWDKYAPGDRGTKTDADGSVYYFPYLYSQTWYDKDTKEEIPAENLRLPLLRQDWVEKVGETMKTVYTPDELFDLLVKFQEQDVNGNGLKDEVACFGVTGFNDNLARYFGLHTSFLCYIDNDGKVQSNFYSENLVPYLEFMKKLYDNNLYDSATVSAWAGSDLSNEVISADRAAIFCDYANATLGETLAPNAQYTPFVLDLDGDLSNGWYAQGDNPDMTFNQYFVTSACEHPEVAARLFDFVYSEEFARLVTGVEGKSYNLDDMGIINYVDNGVAPAQGEPGREEYCKEYFGLFDAGFAPGVLPAVRVLPIYVEQVRSNEPEFVQIKDRAIKEMKEHFDKCDFVRVTPLAMATDEESEKLSEISEALNTYASEMLSDIILGQRDLATLEDGVKELEKLGLKDLMDIIQAQYDRAMEATK